jgi:hypothetical protein
MIKVTVGEQKTQSEKPFPKLMVSSLASKNNNTIVLFTSDSCGTCLQKGYGEQCEVGEYSETWRMSVFVPINEPITLQNA